MTLSELLTTLCDRRAIPTSRVKDLKTSVRYLARALKAEAPEAVTDAETLSTRYRPLLHVYFAALEPGPSPHTVRNTLNNLSFLYRQAVACDLIPTFTPRPERMSREQCTREADRLSPYRHRFSQALRGPQYYCPTDKWPPAVRDGWERYCHHRRLEVRPSTVRHYEKTLASLIGYSLTITGDPITTWDALFDARRLERFIHWHAERTQAPRVTAMGVYTARTVTLIAKHQQRPEFPALQALQRKLPEPEPMHDKQHPDHDIQLKELEAVGLTLLHEAHTMPGSHPRKSVRSPHLQRAVRHQMGLILRLLVRVPMRQRNIREMRLGHNLLQDQSAKWHLHFQGEQLKVGRRGGRLNTFQLPFPPDLTEHLEEFLHQYRPIIPNASQYAHVFLSFKGRPYTQCGLATSLTDCVMLRLGKRFYPHLIRTIYTDTCLLQTHDISTVAFMLNDRPQTVLQRYHELRGNDLVQNAYRFTQALLGPS
jgi:hypothetical protein